MRPVNTGTAHRTTAYRSLKNIARKNPELVVVMTVNKGKAYIIEQIRSDKFRAINSSGEERTIGGGRRAKSHRGSRSRTLFHLAHMNEIPTEISSRIKEARNGC